MRNSIKIFIGISGGLLILLGGINRPEKRVKEGINNFIGQE